MMRHLFPCILISVCFVLTSCQNYKHLNRIPYNRGDSPLEMALMKYDRSIKMDAYSKLQKMKSLCDGLFDYAGDVDKNVVDASRCNAIHATLAELYKDLYTTVGFDHAKISAIQAELEAIPENPTDVLAELESIMAGVEFVLVVCDATLLNTAVEEFAATGEKVETVWADREASWAEIEAAWVEYEAAWAKYESALKETQVALVKCGAVPYLRRTDQLQWLWWALSS
ncbi:MAG: hypothetical protein OXD43_00815 [Bacteroidetes bacterium]|nr:hypothetical protein [Bacteroidota bacterium]